MYTISDLCEWARCGRAVGGPGNGLLCVLSHCRPGTGSRGAGAARMSPRQPLISVIKYLVFFLNYFASKSIIEQGEDTARCCYIIKQGGSACQFWLGWGGAGWGALGSSLR